jgi:hypothetical protein
MEVSEELCTLAYLLLGGKRPWLGPQFAPDSEKQINIWSWPGILQPQVLRCLGHSVVTILTEIF